MKKNRFRKHERLTSLKTIEKLFTEGNVFVLHPYRVFWLKNEDQDSILKIAISVPKKRFKRAVDRNLLKRRTREAYRTQKLDLTEALQLNEIKLSVFFVYINDTIVEFPIIEKQMLQILKKLKGQINLKNI